MFTYIWYYLLHLLKKNSPPKNFSFKRLQKKYNPMLVINLIISLSVFSIINSLTSIFLRWIKQVEVLFSESWKCILYIKSLIFQKEYYSSFKDGRVSRRAKSLLYCDKQRSKDDSPKQGFLNILYIYISQHCVKHRWKVKRVINKAGMWFWWVSCTLIFRL